MRRLLNWIEDERGGMLGAYFKSLLFWNPVLCLVMGLFFGGLNDLVHRSLVSSFISAFVSTMCFGTVAIVIFCSQKWRRYRRLPARTYSRRWRLSLSMMVMPGALYLSFPAYNRFVGIWAGRPIDFNFDDYRVGLLLGSLLAGLFFLLQTRKEARDSMLATEQRLRDAEAERLRAQVAALTAQMNPHLLFNSLNTVASLVSTDPRRAEETVVQLGELYRGVLESSRKMVHPLARELEICQAYLEIERARFGERLRVQVSVDKDVDTEQMSVPALCLQPLVENAVKHGLAPRASGGRVSILAIRDGARMLLAVEDDGVGLGSGRSRPGNGTGLANTAERLRLQYGDAGSFSISARDEGGTRVEMVIPCAL